MKHSIPLAIAMGAIIVGSGLWISRNSQRKGAIPLVQTEGTPTQVPASSLLPPLEDPKVTVARLAKERQAAIEQENNPQLRDGVPETGAGLKRIEKFARVEVTPKLLASWDCGAWTQNATFSRNDKSLMLGSSLTEIYRTSDWSLERTLRGSSGADFSPDGQLVAASNAAPQVNAARENAPGVGIWRLRDGKQLRLLNDKSGVIDVVGAWGPVAFSPDGRRLLTLGEDPNTKWSPDGGDPSAAITEGSFLRRISMKVWDVSSGERLKVLPGPGWGGGSGAWVTWVRTSPRRRSNFEPRFFSGGDGVCQLPDRTLGVRIHWQGYLSVEDLTAKQLIRNIPFGNRILVAAISPNGALVASGGDGQNGGSQSTFGIIKIWRVADGKLLAKFEGKGGSARAITFSRDGKKLVVVGRSNSSSDGIAAVYAL